MMRANISQIATGLNLLLLVGAVSQPAHPNVLKEFRFAGALEFSSEGVLFVGDNIGGAIYAFEIGKGMAPEKPAKIDVESIDTVVASALGVKKSFITINDLVVHPVTQEVYLSVTRRTGEKSVPAIVKVDVAGNVHNVRLAELKFTRQALNDVPDGRREFQARAVFSEPTERDFVKAKRPMHILAIMDIEYYKGEIFVSGISNEEFASTLRRIRYPFEDKYASTKVKIFHLGHDQFETRAPIRSMVAKNFNGTDFLIASYTCTPVVLIPITDLKDGASVTGRTIGDVGNGQPIDMVVYRDMMAGGKEFIFMTNNSRMPQAIPMDGLAEAKAYTLENTRPGMKMDARGDYPIGPVGNPVMFEGSSLQIDLLNDTTFISLTRDATSGKLNLESLSTVFPNTLFEVYSEYDFPGVAAPILEGTPRKKK